MIYEFITIEPRPIREGENETEHRMGVYFEMNMALAAPEMARQLEEIRKFEKIK